MNYRKFFKEQHFKTSSPKRIFYKEYIGCGENNKGIRRFYPNNKLFHMGISVIRESYIIRDIKNIKLELMNNLLFSKLSFKQFKFKLDEDETIYINLTNTKYQIVFIENSYKYYNNSFELTLDERLNITFPYQLEKTIGKERMRDFNIEQLLKQEIKN